MLLCVVHFQSTDGQLVNRPPMFLQGSGDMARFSLPENTPVGSTIYQLKGALPLNYVYLIDHLIV